MRTVIVFFFRIITLSIAVLCNWVAQNIQWRLNVKQRGVLREADCSTIVNITAAASLNTGRHVALCIIHTFKRVWFLLGEMLSYIYLRNRWIISEEKGCVLRRYSQTLLPCLWPGFHRWRSTSSSMTGERKSCSSVCPGADIKGVPSWII